MLRVLLIIALLCFPRTLRSNEFEQINKNFIISNEGIVLTPYVDIAGYKTYCIGRLASRTSKLRKEYTTEQCEALLDYDLHIFVDEINRCITRELTDDQYTAVMDFAYNLGPESYCESTLHRSVNDDAPLPVIRHNFLEWDKIGIKGKLVDNKSIRNRRLREYTLYSRNYNNKYKN